MDSEFSLWLCYVKLLVCDSDENSCQWDLVYCSVPAGKYKDLVGFQNEQLTIIAIFKFHPINRCAIAEIDELEQVKTSIKVLMIEDDLLNFRVWAKWFMRVNLVAYYGFDVESIMQTVANKQIDIIIVNPNYSGKYREVNWMEKIRMLKSDPETAQIPVILKLSNAILVGDRERYLAESGANDAIRLDPASTDPLIEKIQDTISANNSRQNTTSNFTTSKLKNKVSDYQPFKKQKNLILDFIELKLLQSIIVTGRSIVLLFEFLERYNPFRRKYK